MTKDEARAKLTARDTDTKLLSGKAKYELCAIIASESGHPLAAGIDYGHWSKDELVNGILEGRGFGVEATNEAIRALTGVTA